MSGNPLLKTALVHHWLVTMRGGERVFEALAGLFPNADIFTLVCDRRRMAPVFPGHRIHTSLLGWLPFATRWYPRYLPLFPWATERLDLRGYPLVITSDAATLKGVQTGPGAIHICYCHTPMRYVWSGYETYRRAGGLLARAALPVFAPWLRRWDREAAQRVSHFVANSQTVAERIPRYYGRESTVIYPPVDTDYFQLSTRPEEPDDFFLIVSQLVPYKRVDLAVEAFNRCGKRLLVVGEGSERPKLERHARANIRFLGAQPRSALREAMQHARALVFPGEEDFGIVMAEALACGTPVVAFQRGGAREIVTESETGVLFEDQTADSLLEGIARFERTRLNPLAMRASALRFSRRRFTQEFASFLDAVLAAQPSPAAPAWSPAEAVQAAATEGP